MAGVGTGFGVFFSSVAAGAGVVGTDAAFGVGAGADFGSVFTTFSFGFFST